MTSQDEKAFRHRPQNAVRHYARLLGPTGATAGRVVAERDLPLRLERMKSVVRSPRGQHERMRGLVAGPGGRLAWQGHRAPRSPGPHAATVRPIAIATCDMDRPIMLG